jgi:hypothetical protein
MPADAQTASSTDDRERLPAVTTTGPVYRAASRLLQRERRMLAFPALAAVGSVAVLPVAAWIGYRVTAAAFAVLAETLGGVVVAVWGETGGALGVGLVAVLLGVAVGATTVTTVVAWCNLCLVAATDARRRGESVSVPAAVAAATRRLPQALASGALVGGTLFLPWLAEHSTRDRHRWRFARLFGGTYTAARFLAGPAAVVDDGSLPRTFGRSQGLLANRFGGPVMVRIGAVRGYGALGFVVSVAAALAVSVLALMAGASPAAWFVRDFVVVAVTGPLWFGIVYGSAVGAVLKTLLYVALRDDRKHLPLIDVPVEDAVRVIRPDD